MGEVSAHAAFRKGSSIVPASFTKTRPLPYAHPSAAALDSLDTHLLRPKGVARSRGKRVAVLFSGGPASGGHDVLCGIAATLKDHTVLGVHGGPAGLLKGTLSPLDTRGLKGTGGFSALGTDRTKLKDHLDGIKETCAKHRLDAIIIIGGDDSNTNAAFLAHHLKGVQVIGVPKTMDCDLQAPPWLTCTFGFDTACRVYSEMVANLIADTSSTGKYWHFVRLMGRDASHVTLEVALRTHPTLALISEEEGRHGRTLHDIAASIAELVRERRARGQDYGVILIPEGLLEHLPTIQELTRALDKVWESHRASLVKKDLKKRRVILARKLPRKEKELFLSFPERFQEMLSLDRDAHGNLKVSQLPTEELLTDLVRGLLERSGDGFKTVTHFYGYEGRCAAPSPFDSWLGYNLGLIAGSLVADGRTGYIAAFSDLAKGGAPHAVPLVTLLDLERRGAEEVLAIRKRLVREDDPAFLRFATTRSDARHKGTYPPLALIPPRIAPPLSVALNGAR